MADTLPSVSDTLLRNGGLYDAHAFYAKAEQWAKEKPGVPAEMTNSIAEAMKANIINSTVSMDVESREGSLGRDIALYGRMDVDVTIRDEDMGLICHSRHLVLVLEAQRKFRTAKKRSAL
ncbi:hypothetical protein LQW54_003282 [Pestalotiopsis sp. IQ-011]